jgi:hypothetical protein
MNLAAIILAHRDPMNVARLAILISERGVDIAIHYDLNSPPDEHRQLREALREHANIVFAEPVRCDWGQWSLVRATLGAIGALAGRGVAYDYVHLMSGADYPTQPIHRLEHFLTRNAGLEFIEAVNIREKSWVSDGLEHERYQYEHIHNWRTDRDNFDRHWAEQRDRGEEREFIAGLDPYMGSQWWTLTWPTCLGALAWAEEPGVADFFETVWIPDEMFFQTFVGNKVPADRIVDLGLTLYRFDKDGRTVVYNDGDFQTLRRARFFFARKIGAQADGLRNQLDAYVTGLAPDPTRQRSTLELLRTEAELLRWRGSGARLQLAPEDLVLTAQFTDGANRQDVGFDAPVTGRYFCFETLSAWDDGPFAAAAELELLDAEGEAIEREGYTIAFVDSEELSQEDGAAENAINGDTGHFWHSRWSDGRPDHPHQLTIDLGRIVPISGFRYLPRQSEGGGRIKDFRFYVCEAIGAPV